jgi:hypothetical protein
MAKNSKCFECGKVASENHHVIPKSLGGKKTIPLCGSCHALVHAMDGKRRDRHSELTKLGLQRAKDRGVILGNPQNLSDEARALGRKAQSERARNHDANIEATIVIIALNNQGYGVRKIAKVLNDNGFKTSKGNKFRATSVKRLLDRCDNLDN